MSNQLLREEKEFLDGLAEKVDRLIDDEFKRVGLDRAFFDFQLKVSVLNENFTKVGEIKKSF